MTIDDLIQRQNPDGGWPDRRGASWTEPTAYAVLALLAMGESERAFRGITWLLSMRRPDGGWPVCAGIEDSGWVTALVALVPPEHLGAGVHRGAIRWLLETTGEESTWLYRARQYLLGNSIPRDQQAPGWPWTPKTAAWVSPTSLALLALKKEHGGRPADALHARIAEGQEFLLNRMCRGGGWNHGSASALGYPADAYPETTGMALAALQGLRSEKVDRSLTLAERFLDGCRSADAANWLRLGLSAHGQVPAALPSNLPFRRVPEIAVELLIAAGTRGTNLLLTI